MQTNLSKIMKYMHISAVELSGAIHVHPSLVSRWRNGIRRLNPESEYFGSIVQYITNRDLPAEFKNIEVFLRMTPVGLAAPISGREEAETALKGYLSLPSLVGTDNMAGALPIPDSGEFFSFQGGREKKAALLDFFDQALNLTPPRVVRIMIAADVDYYLTDETFYAKWTEKLQSLIRHGHQVYFIYNYRYTNIINTIKNFFWLFSHDNVCGYINQDAKRNPEQGNIFIAGDVFGMTDFITEPNARSPIFSFTNSSVLGQMKKLFDITKARCMPIVSNEIFSKPKDMSVFMRKRMYADNALYIYDDYPFCFPMGNCLISNICSDNGLSDGDTAAVLRAYADTWLKPMFATGCKFPKRVILNADRLFSLADLDEYRFPPHLFADAPLVIRRARFRDVLLEIAAYLRQAEESRSLEIAIVDDHYVSDASGFLFIVKENLFTFVYPYAVGEPERGSLVFANMEIVNAVRNYCDHIWHKIPDENRSAEGVRALLENAIGLLER